MTRGQPRSVVTLLVRASRDAGGRLHGIVERVKTGEKEQFAGAEALARVIEQMIATTGGGRATS